MSTGKIYTQVNALLQELELNDRLKVIEKLGKQYRLENNLRITNESKDSFRNLGLTKKNIDIPKLPAKRKSI